MDFRKKGFVVFTMKVLLVFIFVTVAQCRPEAGYNYRPPFSSARPQHGGGGSSFSSNGANYHQTGFGGTPFGNPGFGLLGGDLGHGSNLNLIGGSGIGGVGFVSGNAINSEAFVSGGLVSQGPALVQKHIYVHVPPPEPEEHSFQRQQVSLGVPQKHYKIIFIKAPSSPSLSQQQIALAAQTQEKTIVYVLVKKPEDITDISLPTITPTQPSKPEVYFIKYKAQKQNIGTTGTGAAIGGVGAIGATSFGSGTGISSIGLAAIHGGGGGPSSSSTLISGTTSTGVGAISAGHGGITGSAISSGSASSSIGGIPAAQYGPPGKSGPY